MLNFVQICVKSDTRYKLMNSSSLSNSWYTYEILSLTKFKTSETFFQAERRFLNSKPTCFIVIGKPVSSFSDLFMVSLVNKLCTVLKYCSFITHQLLTSFEVNMNIRRLVYIVVEGTRMILDKSHPLRTPRDCSPAWGQVTYSGT